MFHPRVISQGDGLPTQGLVQEQLSRLASEKKTNTRPQVDQSTIQGTPKEVFISVPYIPGISEEFRRIFKDTKVQIIFKGCNTLKSLLMYPKDKIPSQLHQDLVYQWTCPEETCSSSFIAESSRCLDNRVKEHYTSISSTIYQHSSIHNHPKADISQFKIIDQDNKQSFREDREAIHIRRSNPALHHNLGKMYIPNIFNLLLGTTNKLSAEISTRPNILLNPPTISSTRFTRAVHLHN